MTLNQALLREPIFPTITAACILVVATITVLVGLLSTGDIGCPSEASPFSFPAVANSLLLHDPTCTNYDGLTKQD